MVTLSSICKDKKVTGSLRWGAWLTQDSAEKNHLPLIMEFRISVVRGGRELSSGPVVPSVTCNIVNHWEPQKSFSHLVTPPSSEEGVAAPMWPPVLLSNTRTERSSVAAQFSFCPWLKPRTALWREDKPALLDCLTLQGGLGTLKCPWGWPVLPQFSSVTQSCLILCTPWTAACQASLSITNSRSLLKLMSIKSVMPSNHLIFCCPLLLLPSIFPSIRVFSNESVLRIRWPKYWSFSFSISPSNEYSGLIPML